MQPEFASALAARYVDQVADTIGRVEDATRSARRALVMGPAATRGHGLTTADLRMVRMGVHLAILDAEHGRDEAARTAERIKELRTTYPATGSELPTADMVTLDRLAIVNAIEDASHIEAELADLLPKRRRRP